ncbi:InlB B-repeat-containing protein [Candidatus Saccharibacteria bacterium]|nr:InlB B-repeat-containing protein [Candidatus Saccharibacteria bacterium]
MQTQTLTLVDPGTVFGLLRWSTLAILVIITIFLIANRKNKKKGEKQNKWLPALAVTLIAAPFLILDVITTTQPEPTVPNTNPVQPTPPEPEPTPDPIPEPEPEPEPEPTVVTPSKEGAKPSETSKKEKKNEEEPKNEEPEKEAHHIIVQDANIYPTNSNNTYTEGDTITIEAVTKAGYTFKRWLSDFDDINNSTENPLSFTMPDEFLLISAEYTANTDTPYVVKHYVMDIAGDYQLEETENLQGTTDTTVTPDAKEYDGCNSVETTSKAIAGDGSTVFEYYYERKEYQFTLNEAEHGSAAANVVNGKYYHGREMTLTANPAAGYHFVKWSDGETANPYTFSLTAKTTLAPEFAPNTDTQYIVNHNQMDVAGAYYLKESETLYGTTDTTVTPDAKEYTGFEEPERQPQQIAGDGSTVFEYNYPRKEIQFILNAAEHGTATATLNNGKYYYGREITLSATPATGYHFVKWSNNETANPYTFELKSETTISAEFAPNTYTIAYDKNNADATGDDMAAQSGVVYDSTVKLNKNTYAVSGWRFLGWSTSADAIDKEYSDEEEGVLNLSSENGATVTLYAVWEEKFPIVWQQAGDCEFHGNNGVISGNCGEYSGQKFINTGIKLFDETNHDKDFDVYFEIEGFSGAQSDSNQTTLFSSKAATGLNIGAPGIVVRGNTNNTRIEYKSTTGSEVSYTYPSTNSAKIRIVRKDGVIYYSLNAKELLFVLDERGNDYQVFDSDVWFGAGEKIIDGQLTPQRVFTGTISNMYIRLGEMDDYEAYTIEFNTNGGKINEGTQANKIATIEKGKSIEKLPVPYRTNYIFQGWTVKGSNPVIEIDDGVTPDSDVTYIANWKKDISFANITNPDIELEIGDTEAIGITNTNSIEGLSFTSSNTSVAAVDDSGNVTAVAAGETTITITGLESGKTKTVNVTVLAPKVQIIFNDQMGNTSSNQLRIGETLGQLANDISKEHYIFNGWYTDETAGEKVNSSTAVTGETTYYAHWTKTVYHLSVTPSTINVDKGYIANFGFGDVSDIESFNYHIEDEDVATVDSTAVTGIATGSTRLVIEGEESTETKYVDVVVLPHMVTVSFNYSDGTPVETRQIEEGASFTELPTKVRENYYLEGWFTQANGQGTQLTTSTEIQSEGNSNYYYAYWLASVATATVNPTELGLTVGGSSTISVDNSNEQLEPFSFSSSDDTIASVNNQGEVTAISVGNATITITGDKTNDTRTISVVVSASTATITFDGNGGTPSVPSLIVDLNSTISELPSASLENSVFAGWWTEPDGGEQLTSETVITEGKTYYAHWKLIVCKKAVELNVEKCKQNSDYCKGAGYSSNQDITFGTLPGEDSPIVGDAYDCNMSGDEKDENYTERFYVLARKNRKVALYSARNLTNSVSYSNAESYLPSKNEWTNLSISFGEKAARFATRQELIDICPLAATIDKTGSLDNCQFLFDGTKFYDSSVGSTGIWLQSENSNLYRAMSKLRNINKTTTSSNNGVRPVIEVPLDQIEGYTGTPYESSDEIVLHTVSSEAAEEYLNNVSTWNTSKNNLLTHLQSNFNSHNCSLTTNNRDVDGAFTNAGWDYADGSVACDTSVPYETSIDSALNVYLANESTLAKGDQVNYTKSESGKLYNLIPGQTYRWEKADDSDVYGYVKAQSTNNRRFITAGPTRNIRDLGGISTVDGRTIAYGRLVRGERIDSEKASVTDLTNLGLDTEYDLRESNSPTTARLSTYKRDQVIHYDFGYNDGDENNASSAYSMTRKAVTDIMNDIIAGKNIYFHCSAGADRAGTTAYLLEGLLGVDDETRYQDYELTSLSGRADRTRYYEKKGSNEKKFVYMMTYMSTKEQIRAWYLAGSSDEQADKDLITAFQNAILE